MADFSIWEKIKIVFVTILSTPLFSIASILGISLIVLMIICIVKKIKISKWIYIIGWLLVILFIVLRYTKLVPTMLDNLVDTIFKCLYFPSLGLYLSIVILSNIIFIILALQKLVRKSYKIVSLVSAITLNILFVCVAGVMSKNKIDITTEINLYTNSTLLVLLQISMGIFLLFILVMLFLRIYSKLTVLDSVKFGEDYEYPGMNQFNIPTLQSKNDEVFVRKVMKVKKKKADKIKVHKLMKRS